MTYTRAAMTTAAGESLSGVRLTGTPWLVAEAAPLRTGKAWSVIHIPTGLPIRAELASRVQAKSLAEAVHTAHPDLPALAALPLGVAPSTAHPDAKAEAAGVLKTVLVWGRDEHRA